MSAAQSATLTRGAGDEDDAHEASDSYTDDRPSTPPRKVKRLCYYNDEWNNQYEWVTSVVDDSTTARCKLCSVTFTVAYDGINAITQHASSKKHEKNAQSAKQSRRMQEFFATKGTPQMDKVATSEITHVYHSVKHHCSYLQQDCSIKVLKCIVDDSEIVKKMSCGCTKSTAIVNSVLYPFAMEVVLVKL